MRRPTNPTAPGGWTTLVAPLLVVLLAATPGAATADVAVGSSSKAAPIRPGEVIVTGDPLRILQGGKSNIAYAGDPFVPGETVTATITGLVVSVAFPGEAALERPGSPELLGPAMLTAVVPATWRTDPAAEIVFDPPLSIRYRAPTAVALDCDRHQGETARLELGVTASFSGTAGTRAWIDETSALPFASVVAAAVPCPVRSDFDGDGMADLAIGVPGDRGGAIALAGAVSVLYGSTSGPSGARDERWSQDRQGVPGASRAREAFGAALATGDFDRDGRADLAVGAPFDRIDGVAAGGVTILYGTDRGLTSQRSQRWSRANLPGDPNRGDQFGASLAAADWNGDGFDDLAIGAPWSDVEMPGDDLGSVEVLYGGPAGLDGTGAITLDRSATAPGDDSSFFGHALAPADFNGDGVADLAISAPNANGGGVGNVGIVFGGPAGLSAADSESWNQAVPGVPGGTDPDDWFGDALAAADFDDDGFDDLAVGAPGDDVLGNAGGQGAVTVLYGTADGLAATGSQWWHQDVPGVPGTSENWEWMGTAVAAGDLNDDGYADLAIGIPSDRAGATNAGAANVIYGGPEGLSAAGAQRWSQASPGVPGNAESLDGFGSSLAIGQFGGDRALDLVIGVPNEAIGALGDDGLVILLFGASGGLTSTGAQAWWQDRAGIEGTSGNRDRYGDALVP